ncbi:hypothetical protein BDV06DRAFT_225525 [Aspergillus oleicola]
MNNRSLLKMLLGGFLLVLLLAAQVLTTPIPEGVDLANVGNVLHRDLDVQRPAIYGATEIYGCTVVIVMDAGGLVIGHFPEETGSSITLESETATNIKIIEPLFDQLVQVDWTDQAVAYIVHSRRSAVKGLKAIKDALMDNGVSQANIKESIYTSGLSTVGSKGKIVVTWEPLNEGGTELQLCIQNDNPVYVRQFDQDGNPCALTG